jgi:hypothetical protein
VIRFWHVTKELFSSVTPFFLGEPTARRDRKTSCGLAFCFAKLAYTETNRGES